MQLHVFVPEVPKVQVIVVDEIAAWNVVETAVVIEQTGRQPERWLAIVQLVAAELVQVVDATYFGAAPTPPLVSAAPTATSAIASSWMSSTNCSATAITRSA